MSSRQKGCAPQAAKATGGAPRPKAASYGRASQWPSTKQGTRQFSPVGPESRTHAKCGTVTAGHGFWGARGPKFCASRTPAQAMGCGGWNRLAPPVSAP